MLSEISKMEKDKYCIIPLIVGYKKQVNKNINEQTKQKQTCNTVVDTGEEEMSK